ncbi:MAG: polysaccharide biosynthesis protein [Planctomycetota bacterium]
MTRFAIAVCCYAIIFAASFFFSMQLRFDLNLHDFVISIIRDTVTLKPIPGVIRNFQIEQLVFAKDAFRDGVLTLVLLKITVVLFFRDWRRRLRYSTMYDVAWSSGLCIVCGILIAALQVAPETMPQIPRGVIIIDTILSAGMLGSARVLANTLRTMRNSHRNPGATRTLIYAHCSDAMSLLSSIQSGSTRLRVVGIVAPGASVGTGLLGGVPVFSITQGLDSILQATLAQTLLIPSKLSGREIREVNEICVRCGVEPHLVPSVDEIPSGRFQLRMRDITIDDLLRREPNQLDMNGIRTVLRNRVVLVTGAAGSIGSEVCRQLMDFGPRKIVLLDQSEFGIFQMEQEFRAIQKDPARGAIAIEYAIEDITDEAALSRVFMLHRPAVVFHAAAYKHVPLMESNPQAAIRNNVFGTKVLVDLADRFGVERFVMISTDKAVRPTNIMGATKLVAEQYLHTLSERSKTRFITVRFGNVLNSAGSVVPTFRRQIEEGGPVTVTDPEMQRYFMTIPEAVQLVLQSAAVGEGGDVLILDMGEPVRIVDLAKDMIRLSGQRFPEDIDIVFTGLRPGEKLYEELFYETEQNAVRVHEKIYRAPREAAISQNVVMRELTLLQEHLSGSRDELREVLWQITSRIVERSSTAMPANAPLPLRRKPAA